MYVPDVHKDVRHLARSTQKLSTFSSSLKRYSAHILNELGEDMSGQSKELLTGVQDSILAARKQLYKDLIHSAKGDDYRLLQTIPGIGPYVAASIIGEIQDIKRFGSTKALIAYAGLDPRIRQSGHTLNNTGKLTKRGSSYLRRSIFIAASVARRYDPQFEALYNKKRAEGKSYTVAVCVVSRKLIAVLRSVLLSRNNYIVPK